jgi:hypothetical protein
MSSTTNYKAMAKTLHKENKTLKGQVADLTTGLATMTKHRADDRARMDGIIQTAKKESRKKHDDLTGQIKTLQEDLEGTTAEKDAVLEWAGKISTIIQGDPTMDPDDIITWVEGQSLEAQAEQTHEDAVRMLGALQIQFNLLQEKHEAMKEQLAPKKQSKKQKGLSGQHRKEDVAEGVLRPFVECRCSAISWANGLAQQCSRHWDKHDDGKESHLCKTHHKLINDEGQFTGSWGLYHQPRPQNWGDHGLKVQKEWSKMVGKPINYKMKQAEYDAQFPEMAGAVSQEVPRFDYPELTCQECAPVEEEDELEFSDDEEGADDEVSLEDLEFSDEEDEESGADDEPVSPKEAELEEALAENEGHTWAPAGHRETLPDGTILEADGTGGVKVIDAPEEEVETEVIDAPEESQSDDDDREYEGAGALLEASTDEDSE